MRPVISPVSLYDRKAGLCDAPPQSDRRYQALTARKLELQEALSHELTERNIDNLLQFRETVALGLGNPTPEERRLWLELLQTKVAVTNGVAVVTCRLGVEAVKFSLLTGYQTC